MADTDKLAAEMLDPNYAGELQHLRPWSEIDRIFREAAATITALEAENRLMWEVLDYIRYRPGQARIRAREVIERIHGMRRTARDISRNRRES